MTKYSVVMPKSNLNSSKPLEISHVITGVALSTVSVVALETSNYGPFRLSVCADHDELAERWAEGDCAAIVLVDDNSLNARAMVTNAAIRLTRATPGKDRVWAGLPR